MKYLVAVLAVIAIFGFIPYSPPPVTETVPVPVIEYIYMEAPVVEVTEVTERRYIQYPVQEYVWDDGGWEYAKNYVPFTVEEAMDVFHSVRPGRWVAR